MGMAYKTLMIVAVPALLSAQAPVEIGTLTVGTRTDVAALDMGKLKGEPARLGWSPDGTQLYFQSVEGGYASPTTVHHYVIDLADGKPKSVQVEPAWFSPYWTSKSHRNAPDMPALAIDLVSEQKKQQTTSVPRGGDLARGGGGDPNATGTSAGEAVAAAYGAQTVTVHTLKLKGEPIGEFVNAVIVPGMTFAWGPRGTQAIAFSDVRAGKLYVMNLEGKKQEISGTKDTLLPAWSHDGTKLAWLQRDGKRKFALKVVELR